MMVERVKPSFVEVGGNESSTMTSMGADNGLVGRIRTGRLWLPPHGLLRGPWLWTSPEAFIFNPSRRQTVHVPVIRSGHCWLKPMSSDSLERFILKVLSFPSISCSAYATVTL